MQEAMAPTTRTPQATAKNTNKKSKKPAAEEPSEERSVVEDSINLQEVEAFKHLRNLAFDDVVHIKNAIQKTSSLTKTQCKLHIKRLEAAYQDHKTNHAAVVMRLPPEQQSEDDPAYWNFRDLYGDTLAEVEAILEDIEEKSKLSAQSQNASSNAPIVVHAPLPRAIPTFSGRYEDWYKFKVMFKDVVDKTDEQPRIKLYHLERSLSGEAAKIVDEKTISDGNYARAWQLLEERYEDKRRMIDIHITGLLATPKMKKESFAELRTLVETIETHVANLSFLGEKCSGLAEKVVVHLIAQSLDNETRKLWESTVKRNEFPEYQGTIQFLKQRVSVLEKCQTNELVVEVDRCLNVKAKPKPVYSVPRSQPQRSHTITTSADYECEICKGAHRNFTCQKLNNATPLQRNELIRSSGVCFNCLRKGHRSRNCPSHKTCQQCQRRHHTLLHTDAPNNAVKSNVCLPADSVTNLTPVPAPFQPNSLQLNPNAPVSSCTTCSSRVSQSSKTVLLLTAIVQVFDNNNQPHPCRVLLDSGSQVNFVTEELTNRLSIPKKPANVPITGINALRTLARDKVVLKIRSRVSTFELNIECLVTPKVTGTIPSTKLRAELFKIPTGITLADPKFDTPDKVDMLIGAEMFFEIMKSCKLELAENQPILRDSHFGWIVSGVFIEPPTANVAVQHAYYTSVDDVEQLIQQFWKIEEVPDIPKLSKEELFCESHFLSTYHRDETGRFIVSLPFKENMHQLNNCRTLALRRFLMLEKRLLRNPELQRQYIEFIREYEILGHCHEMLESDDKPTDLPTYYLPHHAVLKPSSSSTKCRVVFDASAKNSPSESSLNEVLHIGPVVQNDLYFIVLRFRRYKVAFSADVSKMYRQIRHETKDHRFLRIFWREHPSQPLRILELNTVTYGTASAPFLATRCLVQLVEEDGSPYPVASRIIKEETYMDDVLSGADTVGDAIEAQYQLKELLARGGFPIHKWSSNSEEFLESIPEESRETKVSTEEKKVNETIKVLGVSWNPSADMLFIAHHPTPSLPNVEQQVTKRTMYSEIAKCFDPLGLVSPVIVVAKLLLQSLWQLKFDWDDPVDESTTQKWKLLQDSLCQLPQIEIPRWMTFDGAVSYELHGFSDASNVAYGACVYLRSLFPDGTASLRLVTSKSKLAPLHDLSIPRKELCAALLLTRLVKKVLLALDMPFRDIVLWCDSTIVLAWIQKPLSQLQLFVRNRIAVIQDNTSDYRWEYVRSPNNPADIISRGQLTEPLRNNNLWWNGPEYLHRGRYEVEPLEIITEDQLPELKEVIAVTAVSIEPFSVFFKFSHFRKIQRIMGYVLRFVENCRKPSTQRTSERHLTVKELRRSTEALLRIIQHVHLADEINRVVANEPSKTLANLRPIYHEGLLRVGGRLDRSLLPFESRHPIILPNKDPLVHLLIRQMHEELLHIGQTGLVNAMRQRYWLLNARSTVRSITRRCVRCFRVNPTNTSQLMGNLPSSRVVPSPPFSISGVDYAGPLLIKQGSRRPSLVKAYVAVYVCMATKAVHLEAVSDLTTDAFLASLKRFLGRRGMIQQIHSDNATNFRGANRELKELFHQLSDQKNVETIEEFCRVREIEWHFIPPDAPEFGGLWEAAVKSAKNHLKRIVGNAKLTFEELATVLIEIEAVLNSRPLFSVSNDPADPLVITPAHYLIGRPLTALAEPSLENVKANRLTRWQHLQLMREHFWRAWSREYLNTLQPRKRNLRTMTNIRQGMIVLLHNRNLPPLNWLMGQITNVYPEKDGLVRAVDVCIGGTTYRRTVNNISVLPIEDNDTV